MILKSCPYKINYYFVETYIALAVYLISKKIKY